VLWKSVCVLGFSLCLCIGCAHSGKKAESAAVKEEQMASLSQGVASAEVAESLFDFGKMKEDGEYIHDFKVKNKGAGVLQIKKVLPGYFDRSIPPGGEGRIAIKLNPKGCRGEAKKTTLVTCNDPQKPYFMLTVQGKTDF
jgi:hypothetical protein